MVSKCANPDCSASFRYFHAGKLFRMETAAGFDRRRTLGQDDSLNKPLRRVVFYWLCEDCAEKMTVVFDKESGISVRSSAKAQSAVA
jgi:hypothetical protein